MTLDVGPSLEERRVATSFDKAIGRFATAYADQNDRDHAQLVAGIGSGRVECAPGW